MRMRYCGNCEKETGHKRALGLGTMLAIILTLGLWLLVLPLYPTRCIVCGNAKRTAIDSPKWMASPSEKDYDEKMKNRLIGYLVMVGVAITIIVIGIVFNKPSKKAPQVQTYAPYIDKSNESSPSTPEAPKTTPSAEQKMTPADHLVAAKEALKQGDTITARTQLSFIPEGSKEFTEAQKLKMKVAERKIEIAKEGALIRDKELKAKRILYASNLENLYLDKGYDITVKVEGKDASILKMKWVLTSRPVVHKLTKDPDLIRAWRDMGFKKVVFTDGYRSTWYVDLK
jgi:hypothetical protein